MKKITDLELRSNKMLAIMYRHRKELRRMLKRRKKDGFTVKWERELKRMEEFIMKMRLSPEGVEKLLADYRKKMEEGRAREEE